jgi:hypothetical protein
MARKRRLSRGELEEALVGARRVSDAGVYDANGPVPGSAFDGYITKDGRRITALGPEPEQSNRKNRIGMAAKTQRTNP